MKFSASAAWSRGRRLPDCGWEQGGAWVQGACMSAHVGARCRACNGLSFATRVPRHTPRSSSFDSSTISARRLPSRLARLCFSSAAVVASVAAASRVLRWGRSPQAEAAGGGGGGRLTLGPGGHVPNAGTLVTLVIFGLLRRRRGLAAGAGGERVSGWFSGGVEPGSQPCPFSDAWYLPGALEGLPWGTAAKLPRTNFQASFETRLLGYGVPLYSAALQVDDEKPPRIDRAAIGAASAGVCLTCPQRWPMLKSTQFR